MAQRGRQSEIILQKEIENGKLLVERASAGDVGGVKELLDQNVRVNADAYNQSLYYKSKNYLTPLHVASKNGHSEIVTMLIDAEADLDMPDMFGVTPVHLAAENGHTECLRLLLEGGALCNVCTAFKRPQWVSNTVYPYISDTRPLHLAAKNNHIDCIVELMMNGADYNAVDGNGRTSMYIAADAGHEEAVIVHLKNAYGKTILSLPMPETDDTPLHHCVQHNMVQAVSQLLDHGSDVNFRNKQGYSPLHLAVQSCSQTPLEIIRDLVTKGYNSDINMPDGHGITPLEYVSFRGFKQDRRPHIAAFLIAYGASFQTIKNVRGLTLLQHELARGTKDYVILRAIVKTMSRLPSLESLGVNVEFVRQRRHQSLFPPTAADVLGLGINDDLEQYADRCTWYHNLSSSPRSLQHCCRVAVRDRLGPSRLRHIPSLPLPLPLRDYLLLEYDEYR